MVDLVQEGTSLLRIADRLKRKLDAGKRSARRFRASCDYFRREARLRL